MSTPSSPSTVSSTVPTKVPARYVGTHAVLLPAANGPYADAQGQRLATALLAPGDTLMIYPQEAWGQTLKWDPAGVLPPLFLGYGRVLLAEHAAAVPAPDEAQLAALGYEFQPPRTQQFEALVPPPAPDAAALAAFGVQAMQMSSAAAAGAPTLTDMATDTTAATSKSGGSSKSSTK